MKKKLIILFSVLLGGFLILFSLSYYVFGVGGIPTRVNTDFATKAVLHLHHDEEIDVTVTDPKELKMLKDMFSGWAYTDDIPMFTDGYTITMTDGRRSIRLYPDIEGRSVVGIPPHYKSLHLSHKQKKALNALFRKYGSHEFDWQVKESDF